MDCFIHQSYGRIRVRVPALKDASTKAQALVKALSELKGVRKISISEITGSVVIYYDPHRQHASSILKIFQKQRLLLNVVGFPRTPHRPHLVLQKPRYQAVEEWVVEVLQQASKHLLRELLDTALQKTGRMLLRRLS